MDRQGSAEDWAIFYATLGRYVTAAGNAESWMYRLLVAMRARARRPAPERAPMWAGLVRSLLDEAMGGPYEGRMSTLLKGALRRGRLRNDIVHTGWFSVGVDSCAGRRHFANGDGSAMVFVSRGTLDEDVVTMEWFENELERLAQDVTMGR